MGFKQDLQAFATGAQERMDAVVRGTLVELSTRLVMRSPVDTGRFRGNWHLGVGAPIPYSLNTFDKAGGSTLSRMRGAIPKDELDTVYYITNNVLYGMALEMGHSKQAPRGVVRVTAMEFDAMVRGALAEAGVRSQ